MQQALGYPGDVQQPVGYLGDADGEREDPDAESLQKLVRQLRQTLSAREEQLEDKAREQARLEEVTQKLVVGV